MEGHYNAFAELAIIMLTGSMAAYLALKFKLPTIVGYILAGLALSLTLPVIGLNAGLKSDFIGTVAEIGVALLLFAAGIEFSVSALNKIRNVVVIGSILQTVIVIMLGLLLMPLLGFNSFESLLIGVVCATSSTALVIKILEQRDEMGTLSSNIMVGWLIMQDIIVIALFLILDTFAPSEANKTIDLITPIFKAFIVISVTFGVGRFIIPKLTKEIAKTGSRELLLVFVVALSIFFAFFAESLGISFTLGSFLTGLALSESFLQHEVFTEIKPIRDLFTMIFFVSIGTFFKASSIWDNILSLFVIIILIITLKILTIFVLNLAFNVHPLNATKVSLGISQIGEFAFVVITIALSKKWIDEDLYSLILTATIITMSVTPFIYSKSDSVNKFLGNVIKKFSPRLYRKIYLNAKDLDEKNNELKNHIIICGYGKVGKYVAKALKYSKTKYIIIEVDSTIHDKAKSEGHNIIFGDSTNFDILEQANIKSAKAIVVALPKSSLPSVEEVIKSAKNLNPKILTIVRGNALNIRNIENIDHVADPEFEAAMNIIKKLRTLVGINKIDQEITKKIRGERKLDLLKVKTV